MDVNLGNFIEEENEEERKLVAAAEAAAKEEGEASKLNPEVPIKQEPPTNDKKREQWFDQVKVAQSFKRSFDLRCKELGDSLHLEIEELCAFCL